MRLDIEVQVDLAKVERHSRPGIGLEGGTMGKNAMPKGKKNDFGLSPEPCPKPEVQVHQPLARRLSTKSIASRCHAWCHGGMARHAFQGAGI